MDLESVADELYGASPDEFVERRKQRVADARSERDRALVKAIGALRRPTRSAWMVNLLARTAPEDVQRLADLGAALGDAQRRASGPDLRRLAKERQVTLDSLTRSAVELAAAEGYSATEATRMEVSQTLQAALADPDVADLVRTGRVIQPATYAGFGPMDLGLLAAAAATEASASTEASESTAAESEAAGAQEPEQREAEGEPEPEEDPARVAAEAAVQSAEGAWEAAASAAGSAEREAEEATSRADELADRVEELRVQLEAAEATEREARNAARAARKRAQQLQEALRSAEADVQATRKALDSVGDGRGGS